MIWWRKCANDCITTSSSAVDADETHSECNKHHQSNCCCRWHFILLCCFFTVVVELFWHTSKNECIYIYIKICIFIYVYVCIYVCGCVCVAVSLCWHVHRHIGVNAMLTGTKTMLNVCNTYIYIYMHVCTYVCKYVSVCRITKMASGVKL